MSDLHLVDLHLSPSERKDVLNAIDRVLDRGWFVLGPEVAAFEEELAASAQVEHAVGVASGTDALILGLLAWGIGPGDEVVVPAFTAFPTAAAVLEAGAVPVMVDVEADRPILDLKQTLDAVTDRTKAVILVHLYGMAGDADRFARALADRGVVLVEDCAQAQGAELPTGGPVGSVGVFSAFSFYPTKNLGAVGDGGALVTSDSALADEVRAWRSHGERRWRYEHHLPARNSRLDDLQAAVLRYRMHGLDERIGRARELSQQYEEGFAGWIPYCSHSTVEAPHLAVIRTVDPFPDELAAALKSERIGTGRHYPRPLPLQPALRPYASVPTPNADAWASSCLSLPLHRWLNERDAARVIEVTLSHVVS